MAKIERQSRKVIKKFRKFIGKIENQTEMAWKDYYKMADRMPVPAYVVNNGVYKLENESELKLYMNRDPKTLTKYHIY